MDKLVLIARIAGEKVGFLATDVQSVIELEDITPAPLVPDFVIGLSALRSRPLTVIDCARSLQTDGAGADTSRKNAIVVEHSGHLYALTVDAVEDVANALSDLLPLKRRLCAGWERVALGAVDTAGGTVLLVDVVELIAGPPEEAAAA